MVNIPMTGFSADRGATIAVIFSLFLLASLTPLFFTHFPPLHDYAFHLARAEILKSLSSSAFLRDHYELGTFLLPNVAMDAAMLGLMKLAPVDLSGRIFVGLT